MVLGMNLVGEVLQFPSVSYVWNIAHRYKYRMIGNSKRAKGGVEFVKRNETSTILKSSIVEQSLSRNARWNGATAFGWAYGVSLESSTLDLYDT